MLKFILVCILIAAGATMKYKYNKKYLIPTINENPDLSKLFKIAIAFAVLIIIGVIYKNAMLFTVGCVIGIPILLYANIKSNILARKYKSKK